MSDSFELIRELLPLGSALQDDGNPLRIVLDRSVGEWLDGFEQPFDELFLTTATGGWLDAHGRQYGVPRKLDETDEDYRQRIVYEKLDELTPSLLVDVYGVRLFSLVDDFNVYGNSLVSDNPFLGMDGFMGVADDTVISILDKKFILGTGVTWVNDFGEIEYIITVNNKNVLSEYSGIYDLTNLRWLFLMNSSINVVKLILPNAINCEGMFMQCSNLVNVDLSLPSANDCQNMFLSCFGLSFINLSLPNATDCGSMFAQCTGLSFIDLSLPNVTNCFSMFYGCDALSTVNLDLPNATDCRQMFYSCDVLKNVVLNIPKLNQYNLMFSSAPNIETIDVTIPSSMVNNFKSYVTGLNLQHLTSFKINGEEQL